MRSLRGATTLLRSDRTPGAISATQLAKTEAVVGTKPVVADSGQGMRDATDPGLAVTLDPLLASRPPAGRSVAELFSRQHGRSSIWVCCGQSLRLRGGSCAEEELGELGSDRGLLGLAGVDHGRDDCAVYDGDDELRHRSGRDPRWQLSSRSLDGDLLGQQLCHVAMQGL